MKTCNKCNETKEIEEFAFKIKIENKRKTICKKCERVYKRKYYENNKKDYPARNKKKKDLLRLLINNSKKRCIICGETERVCLDHHHLGDKKFVLANGHNTGSIRKVKEEIAKCIILCANCHRKVHAGLIIVGVA